MKRNVCLGSKRLHFRIYFESKVTPCLEVMSLGKEEAMMIEQGKLDIELPKLNSLKLQCFQDEQGDIFPFVFGLKV